MFTSNDPRPLFVVMGNQLFPTGLLREHRGARFVMVEDAGLCTYVRHHKQKIVLFLAAMRSYADELRRAGFVVAYYTLDGPHGESSYEEKLADAVTRYGCTRLVHYEIEDHFFEDRIAAFAEREGLDVELLDSPMFLTTRDEMDAYLDGVRRPFMANFYQWQRKRLGILVDDDGEPVGGQWSFDADNRKPLPKDVTPPGLPAFRASEHVRDVAAIADERFADHPGDTDGFWLPTTRRQALVGLRRFFEDRFARFGDYEDALSDADPFLFHSVLSPAMNLGLITPREIVDRALEAADGHDVPINALEGFVRQVIGWREFIRGVYHRFDEKQSRANFWSHTRGLSERWYDGTTGLPPLDRAIRKVQRYGWAHHIERLMVLGNLMLLCEIEPRQAHRWFMEMFVDSSDWVMGPNVYGMALFSDGGIFASKPYICGSNYLLKMGDYERGPWCDVVDGLYWRFIDCHRGYFEGQPRLTMMPRTLDKMSDERRKRVFDAAEAFLERIDA